MRFDVLYEVIAKILFARNTVVQIYRVRFFVRMAEHLQCRNEDSLCSIDQHRANF